MSSCAAVLESLSKLSITPKTTSHEAAADNKTWSTALSAANPGFDYQVTKTLILKPKTAKSATPTPVVAIALDSTETNVTALGKKLGLKECRFANEDFLQGTFAVAKDAGTCLSILLRDTIVYIHTFCFIVSPFVLSNVADLSTVHLVLDAAILALPGSTLIAFRQGAADKTIFITVDDLKAYFKSIGKDAIEVDFKELAAAAAAAKPANKPAGNKAAAAQKPAKEGK